VTYSTNSYFEDNREEEQGYSTCGESCMILISTVFDWSTRVTDRWTHRRTVTDGRLAYSALCIMLSRAKKLRPTLSTNQPPWAERYLLVAGCSGTNILYSWQISSVNNLTATRWLTWLSWQRL